MILRRLLVVLVVTLLLMPLVAVWLPAGDSVQGGWAEPPAIGFDRLLVSLLVTALAAALAVLVGAAVAGLLTLTDFPYPSLWAVVMLVPFVSPPAVWALGQVYCYGPGGLVEQFWGDSGRPLLAWLNRGHYLSAVLVLAQIHAPLALLLVGRGLSRVHQAGFESARLFLSSAQLILWLAGALRREMAAAFLLGWALGLGSFAVPHVLQCRLYAIEIYLRMTNYLDQAGALRAAAPLLAVSLTAAALFAVALGSGASASPQPQRPVRVGLGWRLWPAAAALAVYLGLTTLLPVAALLAECKSLGLFLETVRDAAPETENTLWIALGAAGLASLAALAVAAGAGRRGWWAAETLAMVPLGVPALIVGLAYLQFYRRTWPVDWTLVADSSLLVMLGLAVRSWPFVTRSLAGGCRAMAPQWHEAAQLSGLSGWRRLRWVSAPLMWDYLAAGAVVAFVLAVGEVEISQLLCPPGYGTLALRLFTFLHFGPTHVAASLAVLQLALTTVPLLLYFLLTNRCLRIL